MKIKPQKGIVQLKIEEVKVGGLNTSSVNSAVEFGEVVAMGEGVDLKKGDKVFVKAWGIDTITHQGTKYTFIHVDTNAILAVVS